MPGLSNRFALCLFIFLITYALAAGVRLYEAPGWGKPSFTIQGEKLQATHDAYFYLAGAKGVSRDPQRPMARLTSLLHSMTELKYGNLGFWMPALFAPLVVLPLILLGWSWRLEEGALPAALLGACSLGFLLRSRLGFYDQDILSLFFALLFCVLLIHTFSPSLRAGWRRGHGDTEYEEPKGAGAHFLIQCMGIGIFGWIFMWYHSGSMPIILASLVVLLLCVLLRAPGWHKAGYLSLGLLSIYGLSVAGLIGIGVVLAVLALALLRPERFKSTRWLLGSLILLGLVILLDTNLPGQVMGVVSTILDYAKLDPAMTMDTGTLSLPSVKQSIREAQSINWNSMVNRVAGTWFIFVPGLLGLAYLVFKKPTALIFVPMLLLSLLSFKLGNRFTMYGGAVIGIGLGFGLNALFLRFGFSKSIRILCQLGIALLVLLPTWNVARTLRPAPILPKEYAQTFIDLKTVSSQDARLWQWWDYGYAGQYYAERITFGDGAWGKKQGLFPLAKVHISPFPRQAAQLMEYITLSQKKEYQENIAKYENMPDFWKPYLADPIAELEEKGPDKAKAFVQSLAEKEYELPKDLPPQYLVVSWENMRLAYWISYFGTWDLAEGGASPGKIQRVRGNVRFDLQNGALKMAKRQVSLSGMDVLEQGGNRHFDWPNGTGVYAILNRVTQELYLMDSTIYRSMMVQMLVREPERFEEHFELVVDRSPWARAYRAK